MRIPLWDFQYLFPNSTVVFDLPFHFRDYISQWFAHPLRHLLAISPQQFSINWFPIPFWPDQKVLLFLFNRAFLTLTLYRKF